MFARISFSNNQKINKTELNKLEKTLADTVKYSDMYRDNEDKINTLRTWNQTFDPNDKALLPDDKGKIQKELVFATEFVELETTKEYLCDLELFLSLHPGLKIEVRGLPKTPEINYSNVIEQILAIQEKFESALKGFDKQIEFNQKCDVHISNLGLLNINQVGYATDYCTEALQDILNKGWRLLAVCVQPDGRRPDYVFGRYDPNGEDIECVHFN
jgi:hypothetical protein